MSESTNSEVYLPNDADIDAVLSQLSDEVGRDVIGELLIKTGGDITEAVLTILTDDNVIARNTSPQRTTPHENIKMWNDFYKEVDKYNIERNIERVKEPLQLAPNDPSTPRPFISSGSGPGAAGSYGAGFADMFTMPSIIPPSSQGAQSASASASASASDIKSCTEWES
jgi:hypothetical protein